MGSWRSWS